MNEYDVKRLALVLSVQAEIEGMKSANALFAITNNRPLYNNEHFFNKAAELKGLGSASNDQLFN